jgi:hypothetical protein
MARDRRLADREGLDQLVDRRLAESQASEDRTPGRVGECGEGGVEVRGAEHDDS